MITLVTGAGGFIGSALCEKLACDDYRVRGSFRLLNAQPMSYEGVETGAVSSQTNWTTTLRNVESVVHLAGRAHVTHGRSVRSIQAFRATNVEATENLARQAGEMGVKRFIFLSSIKVNGESTRPGSPFLVTDQPKPLDPYGVSKYEAEQLLIEISDRTGMELVIIRPPLVYGPGVKGNFDLLIRCLALGVPLPLASLTDNRRSFISIANLVNLVEVCLRKPEAANQIFLASDGEDLSTAELLRRLSVALERPLRLIHIPKSMLMWSASIFQKRGIYERLCSSLQVDISKTKEMLDWERPQSVDEGLRSIVTAARK
ncbi:MAG: NAD-dependent epimerase/dehydratase family protein [Betaproteobacteria bacterium]|jgi:nucleoside-diphosphate-sugar epimerase|nr:NAD-dependent epimerase/dehydratase family protein [Betaproteobacteria bacterium]